MADMRRRPLFFFVYDDLLEDTEWRDEAVEVREAVAIDEVLVGLCSLEVSDGG